MAESMVLKESLENLFYFEYYEFKQGFGLAFLILGLTFIIWDVYKIIYNQFQNNIGRLIEYLFASMFLTACLLLIIIIGSVNKSLHKTQIINGVLVKFKTFTGFLIIILGFIIFIFFPLITLQINFSTIAIFIMIVQDFILIGIYYAETKLFFPDEPKKSFKIFLLVPLSYFVSSIFFSYLFQFFNPGLTYIDNTNPNYPFFQFLSMIPSIINGILLVLFGIYERRTLPENRRDLHE